MVIQLNQADFFALMQEGLGTLHPDKAATDDGHLVHLFQAQIGLQSPPIPQRFQSKEILEGRTIQLGRHRRHDWRGASGYQQLIIAIHESLIVEIVPHGHRLCCRIYRDNFVEQLHSNSHLLKHYLFPRNHLMGIMKIIPHIIRQAASSKTD